MGDLPTTVGVSKQDNIYIYVTNKNMDLTRILTYFNIEIRFHRKLIFSTVTVETLGFQQHVRYKTTDEPDLGI